MIKTKTTVNHIFNINTLTKIFSHILKYLKICQPSFIKKLKKGLKKT